MNLLKGFGTECAPEEVMVYIYNIIKILEQNEITSKLLLKLKLKQIIKKNYNFTQIILSQV